MSKILSIGITSYNRIHELRRCIRSIKTIYPEELEVIVSEDCSLKSKQIGEMLIEISKECSFELLYRSNERNMGFDLNLKEIIRKSSGKYVFFLSDDDMIRENCLDQLIPFLLESENECIMNDSEQWGVCYASFQYLSTLKKDRLRTVEGKIAKGERSAAKYIYDSILFSGLIFKRELVSGFSAEYFVNHNYFQVYLFLQMILTYGGYYFQKPMVICVGDGENAYGLSESSGGNPLIANRKSVKSNLEFNKTLFKVIRKFDEDTGCSVFKSFEKQYSLHSYSGLSIARKEGMEYYEEYWGILKSLDIDIYPIVYLYYWTLKIFGTEKSEVVMRKLKKLIKKE